jgi:hypothetical protein
MSPRQRSMQAFAEWTQMTAAPAQGTARGTPPRQLMAQGQAGRQGAAITEPADKPAATTDDWASECLFDCYNG